MGSGRLDIPGMVLVKVDSVMMLTTGQTSTTWMLAVLSYSTVTGRYMAAAAKEETC
jgi:hypothetical protein